MLILIIITLVCGISGTYYYNRNHKVLGYIGLTCSLAGFYFIMSALNLIS
jgi:hypothetical protein